MSVPQEEQIVLEDWLDGELSESACSELRDRLSRDPLLAAELARLQSERKMRSAFWQCCEPSTDQLDGMALLIRKDCLKHHAQVERFRMVRNGAAIAATFALVFGSGWMSRGRIIADKAAERTSMVSAAANDPVANLSARNIPVVPVGNFSVPQGTPWTNESSLGSYPVDSLGLATRRPTYRLLLVDPFGTPIESQEVDDVRDPQKLSARFAELQGRLQDAQHSATVVNQFISAPNR